MVRHSFIKGLLGSDGKRLFRAAVVGSLLLAVSAISAQAQLTINVGNFDLDPNASGQTITLSVQNTGASDITVAGLSFDLLINNDMTDSTTAPNITGVNIIGSDTIFYQKNTGQFDTSHLHRWVATTTVSSSPGSVTFTHGDPATTIATITFDTTGVPTGVYALNLTDFNLGTHYQDTVGGKIYPNIVNGTLTVVPEPNAAAIVGGILILGAGVRRWQRRTA